MLNWTGSSSEGVLYVCSGCPVSVCVYADRRGSSVCPQLSKRGSWDESGGRPPSLGHGSAGQRRNNSVGGGAGKPWTASKSPDTLSPASSLDSVLNHSQVRLFLCVSLSLMAKRVVTLITDQADISSLADGVDSMNTLRSCPGLATLINI